MPVTTYNKQHSPRAVIFDTLQYLDFDAVTVVASQANTAVQAYLPLPCAMKIYGVAIVASGASGVTAFNVVMGTGAEGSAPPTDTIDVNGAVVTAANGNPLFTADQAVTLTAGTPQTFATSVPDAIWPKGALLTLRYVSGAAVAGVLKVSLLSKPYDVLYGHPYASGTDINFSYATDV